MKSTDSLPSSRLRHVRPYRSRLNTVRRGSSVGAVVGFLVASTISLPGGALAQDDPTTVQPGAPGEPTRLLDGGSPESGELPEATEADARFVRAMILHHAQALRMTALVADRTTPEDIQRLASRIEISQRDEIELLEAWLRDHGASTLAPSDGTEEADPVPRTEAGSRTEPMPGMLSAGEIARLEAARGPRFERLFLELMIRHHEGALEMVAELFGTPGAGQVSSVYHFASEIQADQQMEIRRIRSMLEER